MDTNVKRGEIYYADLSPVVGSEQGGVRPVLIVQNDTGNRHSPTVIAAAITSPTGKAKLPTHYLLKAKNGLELPSLVRMEQLRTIDKRRLETFTAGADPHPGQTPPAGADGPGGRRGDGAGGRRHCGELRPAPQQIGIAARRRVHNLPQAGAPPGESFVSPGGAFLP